jgi:hypothetical protein
MTTCDRLSAQAAALFDDLERQIAASSAGKTAKGTARRKFAKSTRRYRNCIPAGDGHWMLQPVSGAWESFREFDQLLLEVEARLTHVSNEGRSVLASETLRFGQFPCQGGTAPELLSVKTFDFDGDGVSEIILETSQGCGESKHSLHTMVNGRIGPYEPIAGIHIDKMIDYDKDGRMDIVSILNYWSAESCWGSDEYYRMVGLPSVLYHSLPDGTFSPNDSMARRYLRNQCPSMPKTLFVPPEADWELDSAKNIACARAWGMTSSELQAWIARELGELPDRSEVSCPTLDAEFFLKWAKIDPPLVLRDESFNSSR